MSFDPSAHPFCIVALLAATLAHLVTVSVGCSATQPVADGANAGAYLELDVEPSTAKIYIDGDYEGVVEDRPQQVVPIEPGQRRLELRAESHLPQRFDLDVEEGRWLSLRTRLEPDIEWDDDSDPSHDDELPTPSDPSSSER